MLLSVSRKVNANKSDTKKIGAVKVGAGLEMVVLPFLNKRGFAPVVGLVFCLLASSVVQSEERSRH